MSDQTDIIIGTGWAFPPRFDPAHQSAAMVTGEEDIFQSLFILFGTQRGERILELDYGCDLLAHVFQPMTASAMTELRGQILRAVRHYESRIVVEAVNFDVTQILDGRISIELVFIIDATNNRRNIVFHSFSGREHWSQKETLVPST